MAEVTIDPLIRFHPSKELLEFVEDLEASEEDFPKGITAKALTVSDLRYVYGKRHKINKDKRFHELMEECEMVLPRPKFPPRNPELEARIRRLKAEQANLEYNRMTEKLGGSPVLGKQDVDDSIGKQLREINQHLLLVFQFVITVLCSFAFGYMAPYLLRGVTSTASRILTGVIFAFVAAVADLYFVVKFLLETEGLIGPGSAKIAKKTN